MKTINNKLINQLIFNLMFCKSGNELRYLLKGLLTPQELEEVATRLEIINMLKRGIPQRQIAEKLKVGIATVVRGSREIKKGFFKNIKKFIK